MLAVRNTASTRKNIHKEYVTVIARFDKYGKILPVAIRWGDSCIFGIDEIMRPAELGPELHGRQQLRFHIRMAELETYLHLERTAANARNNEPETLRWWLYVFEDCMPAEPQIGA